MTTKDDFIKSTEAPKFSKPEKKSTMTLAVPKTNSVTAPPISKPSQKSTTKK